MRLPRRSNSSSSETNIVDSESYQRLKLIFLEVRDLPPGRRGTALASECGENAELRQALDELLVQHDSRRRESLAGESSDSSRPDARGLREVELKTAFKSGAAQGASSAPSTKPEAGGKQAQSKLAQAKQVQSKQVFSKQGHRRLRGP